jgi:hypothetical protein
VGSPAAWHRLYRVVHPEIGWMSIDVLLIAEGELDASLRWIRSRAA